MTERFSDQVRKNADETLGSFFEATEQFGALCDQFARTTKSIWIPDALNTTTLLPELFNQYVDMPHAVYLAKFSRLTKSLIRSVNDADYVTYGLVARSMIEHAAILRYYWEKKLFPTIDVASQRGHVLNAELIRTIESLDQHLRGTRFDWLSFELRDYQTLKTNQAARREKKADGKTKKGENTLPDQVNVFTAIDHWAKEQPAIHVAYDLFCDLVHPNVGSTFLVMTHQENALVIDGNSPPSVGFSVFCKSFPLLASSAIREASRLIPLLPLIRYQPDELKRGIAK